MSELSNRNDNVLFIDRPIIDMDKYCDTDVVQLIDRDVKATIADNSNPATSLAEFMGRI